MGTPREVRWVCGGGGRGDGGGGGGEEGSAEFITRRVLR